MATVPLRAFGGKPKPPAAGGGGDAAAAAAYEEPRRRTGLEQLVEQHGIDAFLFGPPSGVTKLQNAHRDYVYPKLADSAEFLAKRMRELYTREGTISEHKIYFDPVRER